MKNGKTVRLIILLSVVVVVLIGMITATAILSNSKKEDFEYVSADKGLDYVGSAYDDADWQRVENFKSAISDYFGELINDSLGAWFDIEEQKERYLYKFAERITKAMSEARVPAVKLDKTAEAIRKYNVSGIFKNIKDYVAEFDDIDDLQNSLVDTLSTSLFSVMGSFLDGIMDETGLTENELALFFYYYLEQNTDEGYLATLKLLGKDYFTSIVANTIYAMVSFRDMATSDYLLQSTSHALYAVVYQLGSAYINVEKITGGGATLEKVLTINWDFDEDIDVAHIQEYIDKVNGKVGDTLAVIGATVRTLSASDIELYCKYLSLEESKEKNDALILSMSSIAKSVYGKFDSISKDLSGRYANLAELTAEYAEISTSLREISYYVSQEISMLGGTADTSEIIYLDEFFTKFNSAVETLNDKNITEQQLLDINEETEEYQELLSLAKSVLNVQIGIEGIVSDVINIAITEQFYALFKQEINGNG